MLCVSLSLCLFLLRRLADSTSYALAALDLLLTLSSAPLVEAENLVSHPVVLASTEYVWRNGLLPSPRSGTTSLSWKESFIRLDRFSIPRCVHPLAASSGLAS